MKCDICSKEISNTTGDSYGHLPSNWPFEKLFETQKPFDSIEAIEAIESRLNSGYKDVSVMQIPIDIKYLCEELKKTNETINKLIERLKK